MANKSVTLDGNEAAATIAYNFTEIAAIYPITPSSPMAEHTDDWSANGRRNMFGQTVRLIEMQSEAGAIGAVHGAAQTGSLATTFTSSQGLMLMIPVLHRIAGERLPVVLHVAARTVGTHALSIFGDHSDVMGCRNTGFAMLCSGSVQEVIDLAGVAHLAAVRGRTPFMHFFDGFRTSHEVNTVEMIDVEKLTELMDAKSLHDFRSHALNPEHPMMRGTVQNPDLFFQMREACNVFYDNLPSIVEGYLEEINSITGRDYHLFNYYGADDAENVIVAMGSVCGTAREVVKHINAGGGKTGLIQVHLYRPFSAEHLFRVLPETVKNISVLDRTKEPGSVGEPLLEDICTAIHRSGRNVRVTGGRYGLSSKDTDPSQIYAVFRNMSSSNPMDAFTIGINDDVTHHSLAVETLHLTDPDTVSCKFWGLGGDGTVGANKNTVHIVSECAGLYGQAYFEYDAKKSFGVTKSHLRFSKKPVCSSYLVSNADFVACHNRNYLRRYDIVQEIREGGKFLLNTSLSDGSLEDVLSNEVKRQLALRKVRFYVIDATSIALKLGLGNHTNTVLQAAFFAASGVMDLDTALGAMKDAARKTYFKKGDKVVELNLAAIDCGASEVREIPVPQSWAELPQLGGKDFSAFPSKVRNFLVPVMSLKGDDLPVSLAVPYSDGTIKLGFSEYEKRGIATKVPKWNSDRCIQCNRCSLVCPHAVIRPFLLNEAEKETAPAWFASVPANGAKAKGLHFSLVVSDYDCTGCGSCAASCPVQALEMTPAVLDKSKMKVFDYSRTLSDKGDLFDPFTIKGSQFRQPLLEFSAACAGCGETPYAKVLTQLFGDRVYWANATGCSQAWGSAMPVIPYTKNNRGFGPAWTNSLFENNAELCLGMCLSVQQRRALVKNKLEEYSVSAPEDVRNAISGLLDVFEDLTLSRNAADRVISVLRNDDSLEAVELLASADMFAKKTFWMFGGDGWAYDIGFGGLDHVVATGENVNVLIVDTEVYSNTGGQSSKATPIGAVAKFASSGKKSVKKDLGRILMNYGNVYVAQVAMGADPAQMMKAIKEAVEFEGPSVIIAYAPCTAHGICAGMQHVQEEMKKAVESGYWLLYRFCPGKEHPLHIDSKAPSIPYEDFLSGEVRYASLNRTFPENARELFTRASREAAERYRQYKVLEEM